MTKDDCLFCKIAAKEIPSKNVWEGKDGVAFHDINPQAPTHIVLIPRKHMESIAEAGEEDRELLGSLLINARRIAREQGLENPGYRLVINCGPGAGQTVFHLHLHILGGRRMKWPPG